MLSLTLKEVSGLLKTGQVSASELYLMCLKRLRSVEDLNAVTTLTASEAQKQAEKSSHRLKTGKPLSLLDGIPSVIKDNYSTQGVKTSCGSKILHNYVPPYNATVVQRLVDSGSVILGKSNMDEFAMGSGSSDSFYGPVRNPWKYKFKKESIQRCSTPGGTVAMDKRHSLEKTSRHLHSSALMTEEVTSAEDWFVSGGSSGGSAAAVASGGSYFGVGSDTGGSVRIPASFCGIVGLKPTYGLVSRHGLISLVNSMDVPGIFTRSIDDAVEVLNALAGHDEKDSTTVPDEYLPFTIPDELSVKDVHVGIPKDFSYPGLTSEVEEAWTMLADTLDKAGAKVSQVSLPHNKYCLSIYAVLSCCEVASNMARYDGIEFGHRADVEDSIEALFSSSRHQGFNDVVRGRILCGNYFLLDGNYENYFIKAQKVRRMLLDDFTKVYQSGVDVILTPTSLNTALNHRLFEKEVSRAKLQTQDIYNTPANLAGIPAVSVPIQLSKDGLPISLQLLGQSFKEKQMLTVAKWIEQEMNFPYLKLDYLD